jgi:hypothetical protein
MTNVSLDKVKEFNELNENFAKRLPVTESDNTRNNNNESRPDHVLLLSYSNTFLIFFFNILYRKSKQKIFWI